MSSHPSIEEKGEDVFLKIRVHPSSSKNKIVVDDYSIEVYVNDPPDKGKANKAIIKLISKSLSLSSSSVSIVKGMKSHTKIILLKNTKIENIKKNLV